MTGLLLFLKAVPWRIVGVALFLVACFSAGVWVRGYTKEYERRGEVIEVQEGMIQDLQTRNAACFAEKMALLDNVTDLERQTDALLARNADLERAYRTAANQPPQIQYLPYAGQLPTNTADCGLAALGAWKVLDTSLWLERNRR